MHFIENGVRRKVLDFHFKSKTIFYAFYKKWSQRKSS